MSAIWAARFVMATRPRAESGGGRTRESLWRASAYAGGAPCSATTRNASPSRRQSVPNLASQRRTPFSRIALNTGLSSPDELLMTWSTCAVAAFCSSASASFFCRSDVEARLPATRALAFVRVERSLRPRVGLFAPLRDKGHLVGTGTDPCFRGEPRIEPINPNRIARRTRASSLDHLVGAGEQRRRHIEAEQLGGSQVDDEIEFGRLLDRNVAWLCPAQNFIDQVGSAAPHVRPARSIRHQTSRFHGFPHAVHGRQSCAHGQGINANPIDEHNWIRNDVNRLRTAFKRFESRRDISSSPDFDRHNFETKGARRRPNLAQHHRAEGIAGLGQ